MNIGVDLVNVGVDLAPLKPAEFTVLKIRQIASDRALKTLPPEVLAQQLGLNLYRIDLAATVNKYIGETEKNLRQVFAGVETSGAVLLFDEAGALFGRCGEVKDRHDRFEKLEHV